MQYASKKKRFEEKPLGERKYLLLGRHSISVIKQNDQNFDSF